MSIASFTKEEFQALLNCLHRVEVKGLTEAQALLHLGSKLKAHIDAVPAEVEAEAKVVEAKL